MMCSKFIRDEKHAKHGRLYLLTERFFDGMLAAYTRGLDFVLRHQRMTLLVFFITLATTVGLYVVEPKGFFPQQDTGIITGLADASQDVSFDEMVRLQQQAHRRDRARSGCRRLGNLRRRIEAAEQRIHYDRIEAEGGAHGEFRSNYHSAPPPNSPA